MIKRALISVSDKTGVVELAKRLDQAGVEIISTGGTQRHISEAGVSVVPISDITGFPEIMDGRVKTLHPAVHAALLARRDMEAHMRELVQHGFSPIDMVVVNLYPFRETVSKPGVTKESAVENIDIGGPSMIRSAAKNHEHVLVLVNPNRYEEVLSYIERQEAVPASLRLELAREAFSHTAAYDSLISRYLSSLEQRETAFPSQIALSYEKRMDLRYGENPHQQAALYVDALFLAASVAKAEQLHGKELSYNNIVDADAALACVLEFEQPCAVAVKHANPCGVATAECVYEAYRRAYTADPVSIFGGIVAVNRPLDAETAEMMKEIFLEVVIAPEFSEEALDILRAKKNLRLLKYSGRVPGSRLELKNVTGGLLVQDADIAAVDPQNWRSVTRRSPSAAELEDLGFAWKVVKHVKSNAIVLAKHGSTCGIGPGQPNRIDSARLAISRAAQIATQPVLASDAMIPFPDVVHAAGEAGITAIVQPGGSVRDQEAIEAADSYGMAMVFTGIRHFRH